MDITRHLLQCAQYIPSPHCDDREEDDISLLVIHNISLPPGKFGGPFITDFFLGQLESDEDPFFDTIRAVKVSAHCLIRRDGSVTQYVPFHKRAWHAGVSCFDGRSKCNDFSIGIELEGTDDLPYTDQQYQALQQVTKALMAHYPAITPARIAGHQEISPGRKTDPGPSFNWNKYRALLE
ncbi:1,6-anhydro-N-acetylmuramyl-L-alanine amidase AmpD [Veronia nyctiphanis]|uniref:1,6-anhydro-N-acetylmuramyl-L-alanine amidase AmpD n=1 Tax=Veronia nyctiphanis TaxID=1278244 RepID=A0A4Q0YNE9_9GAMM|nr:1,6-anhydro-N-acetylmuramyl-L-alanine amidase AmpD [Veronia nyctiphanis]RXJ72467.1 1,6-anhydro-N-acetylmuramyl-L-alanine amidase AmpD [Veronia nyctiphanis]